MKRLMMLLVAGVLLVPVEGWGAVPGMTYSNPTYSGHGFQVVTVDLNANFCFLTAFGNNDYIGGRQRVNGMAVNHQAALGINADYFGGTQPPDAMAYVLGQKYNCDRFRTSLGISTGNQTSIQTGYNGPPRFSGDEVCGGTRTDPAFLYNVVGGGPQIVKNGARFWTRSGCCTVNGEGYSQHVLDACEGVTSVERISAAGVSQDGNTMYVVVSSGGVDVFTVMDFLISLGSYAAIKFDGGSSSELFFDGATKGGAGAQVAEALLAISAPTTPSLNTPPDGASGVSTTVGLDWSEATRAVGYEVQVGTSCGSGGVTSTATSSATISSLAQGTMYFWRVRAKNECGAFSSWSGCRSFTTSSNNPCLGTGSPCPGRFIPHAPDCLQGPSQCCTGSNPNLQTLPDQSIKQWMGVGQPIRDVFKPNVKYSIGLEYEATTAIDLTFGLGNFTPGAKDLGLVISQSSLPVAGEWKTFWSTPFTPTAEQLEHFSNLKLFPSTADGFVIRNVRIVAYQQ